MSRYGNESAGIDGIGSNFGAGLVEFRKRNVEIPDVADEDESDRRED